MSPRHVPASAAELQRVGLFGSLSGETIAKLAGRMVREQFPAGTAIVIEGDNTDRFYVLLSGLANVWQDGRGTRVPGGRQERPDRGGWHLAQMPPRHHVRDVLPAQHARAGDVERTLHVPDDGRVEFDGSDLGSMGEKQIRRLRSDMTVIFQEPYQSLNPRMSIGSIIEEPMIIHERSLSRSARFEVWDVLIGPTSAKCLARIKRSIPAPAAERLVSTSARSF